MTTPQLPGRPNLEQLRRQAKDLLRSAQTHEPAALARFRALPAFARESDDQLAVSVALHDAQSVIARELGFASWKVLVERVEELALGLDAAVDQFIEAATEVRRDRAQRLLELHPGIANASFHAALVLGDLARVEARLARHPSLVTEQGGPREWPSLLYVCHTGLGFGTPGRAEGLVAVARRLLELGADPNTQFPWLHHGVHRRVLWGAACTVRLLPLAEVLLKAGADPNDGVTLPIAASGGDTAALDLLHAYGADPNQAWSTDGTPALYAILNWSDTSAGIHWLLDHGADPDPVIAASGETPLHVVARRGTPDVAEHLARLGANVTRPRNDGRTPYAVAELSGNTAVAEWLAGHGGETPLSDVDRLVAACSRGDKPTAEVMLRARPALRNEIAPEHYGALYRAAERGDGRALDAMMTCGFDPNRGDDDIGKTALHAAAMEGWADAVRVLLAHGASVSVRDREFHAQPLVWAAEGLRSHGANGHDFASVGRLLLAAGSPVDWEGGAEPSEGIRDIITEWQRSAAG